MISVQDFIERAGLAKAASDEDIERIFDEEIADAVLRHRASGDRFISVKVDIRRDWLDAAVDRVRARFARGGWRIYEVVQISGVKQIALEARIP